MAAPLSLLEAWKQWCSLRGDGATVSVTCMVYSALCVSYRCETLCGLQRLVAGEEW